MIDAGSWQTLLALTLSFWLTLIMNLIITFGLILSIVVIVIMLPLPKTECGICGNEVSLDLTYYRNGMEICPDCVRGGVV